MGVGTTDHPLESKASVFENHLATFAQGQRDGVFRG